MNLKLIYWEASWNMAQAMYDERYPHYGLLLKIDGDIGIVLYYTSEKQMVISKISKKITDFVELAEVEVPYTILESVQRYMDAKKELHGFAGTFLSYVEEYRGKIEKVDDLLEEARRAKMSPEERFLDRLTDLDGISQPFPRKPKAS